MSIFNIFGKKESQEQPEERSMGKAAWLSLFGDNYTGSNSKNPLSISTAYACIKLKSNTIASTELKYYRKTDKGNVEINNHQLVDLMKQPMKNISYYKWMSTMNANLESGEAFAYINRQGSIAKELILIEPTQVSIMETRNEFEPFYYQVTLVSGRQLNIYPEDMLHLYSMSLDGISGISVVQQHKLIFDSAKGQNEYHKTFINNSANISGVIETEKKLSKEAVEELRNNFSKKFAGSKNAGRTPVLPEGMKYKQLTVLSPLDADYINTKKMTKEEVAEIYGVPLSMLASNASTYSNAEQDSIKFHRYTIQPIQQMIAEELSLKLIPTSKQQSTFFEFSPDLIKLSSIKERAEAVSMLKREGILTPNESREYYNKPAVDNGDELIIQINTAPQNLVEEKMEEENKNIGKEEPKQEEIKETEVIEEKNNEIEMLKREIQKIKSDLGRIKK